MEVNTGRGEERERQTDRQRQREIIRTNYNGIQIKTKRARGRQTR